MPGIGSDARMRHERLPCVAVGLTALVLWMCGLCSCSGMLQHWRPDEPSSFAAEASAVDLGEPLLVGSAARDVTPDFSTWLAGFSLGREATGVARPLEVRAMVMMRGSLRVALVGIDSLGFSREDADWIKGGITGFANGNVFLAASHTHAAPDLIGMWGWYFFTSGRDHRTLQILREQCAAAVAEAVARAQPAELSFGRASLPDRGLVRNSNRPGVFDRDVSVLHARRASGDGEPLGTLLHLACHPEVMSKGLSLLSPDFVGPLCDSWRESGLGQAVFFNGALGAMITPDVKERDDGGVVAMGEELAAIARRALDSATPLPADALTVRRRDVYLPLTSPGLRLGRLTLAIPRDLYSGALRATVGLLQIGDLLAACVPGEMEPLLAQRLRSRLGRPDLLVFGLVDDEVGYLMSEVDAEDKLFTYERSVSPGADSGELVLEALATLASDSN